MILNCKGSKNKECLKGKKTEVGSTKLVFTSKKN